MKIKKTKFQKRLISLLLVLFLCANNFAAIVSDNDGSAFITKAEFDSLKNTFQSQIDQYNTSIDNKIDGAIAAYLAGIKVIVKQEFETPVSNYQDIKWKRKLDVYGNYINWRNATTYNKYTDLWYEPHFDKRATFRDANNQIHLYYQRFEGQFGVRLNGNLDISGCSYPVVRSDWGTSGNMAPAVSFLDCEYDQDPPMVKTGSGTSDMPFKVHRGFNSRTGATPWDAHGAERWNGSSWVDFPNFEITRCTLLPAGSSFPWFQSLPLETDGVLNGYLYFNVENRSTYARVKVDQSKYTLQTFGFGTTLTMDDTGCNNIVNQTNIKFWDPSSTLFTAANVGGIYSDYISTNGARQNADVAEMMLGSDYDLEVNLARVSNGTKFVGTGYDRLLTYSDLGSIGWDINAVDLSQYLLWTADTTNNRSMTYTTPVSTNLAIPFMERYRFDKMQSPYYKNGGEHLLYGQGLPLSTYLYNKGKVTITFDYDIGISVGGVPSGATGIKVDLKKTDFLSGNDDFYSGKRDEDKATEKFKDAIYDDTTKKVKIILEEVPVGSAIWLRIAPKSTSGGLWAKMSNLQMAVEN